MQRVWETTSVALRLIAAVAAGVRFGPRPLPPEQITSNGESRTPDNPKRKEFFETNLNRKFFYLARISLEFFQADSGRSELSSGIGCAQG
jgi:hypothetical protein